MSAVTLLAKPKPITELPAWALCCDEMRKVYESQDNERVVEVKAEVFLAEVECRFCHKITTDLKYRREVKRKYGAIAVDCFEFDEGPAQLAHGRR